MCACSQVRGTSLFAEVQSALATTPTLTVPELDESVTESSAALCTVLLLAARSYAPLRAALGGDGSPALSRWACHALIERKRSADGQNV